MAGEERVVMPGSDRIAIGEGEQCGIALGPCLHTGQQGQTEHQQSSQQIAYFQAGADTVILVDFEPENGPEMRFGMNAGLQPGSRSHHKSKLPHRPSRQVR